MAELTDVQHTIIQQFHQVSHSYQVAHDAATTRRKQEEGQAAGQRNREQQQENERFHQEQRAIQSDQQQQERSLSEAKAFVTATRDQVYERLSPLWRSTVNGGIPMLPPRDAADARQQISNRGTVAVTLRNKLETTLARYPEPPTLFSQVMLWVIGVPAFLVGIVLASATASATGFFVGLILGGGLGGGVAFAFINAILTQFRNDWATLSVLSHETDTLYQAALTQLQQQFAARNNAIDTTHNQNMQQIQTRHQQVFDGAQQRYQSAMQGVETTFLQQVTQLRARTADYMATLGIVGASWDDALWQQWQPPHLDDPQWQELIHRHGDIPLTRIGAIQAPFTTDRQKNEQLLIPAIVRSPGGDNVLIKVSGDGKDQGIEAAQSLMLHLLATQPPGKVRFTLIDPVHLGNSIAPFMHLKDYREDLISQKAWSEPRHIDEQLTKLTAHMENVIQEYLRDQYSSITTYNAQAGALAQPYRVLVIMDFPVNFSEESARRLVSIASNGPRCGVMTILLWDTQKPLPHGFEAADLERCFATKIAWNGHYFIWDDPDFRKEIFAFDRPPAKEQVGRLLQAVGQGAKAADTVVVPFASIAPAPERWWQERTSKEIRIPLGQYGATKLQDLVLDSVTQVHAVIAGKTGTGKTTLIHDLIINAALKYGPEELELYLIDFKRIGFPSYISHHLPHARIVAIDSEREFGLSVLQGLVTEMEWRKDLFSGIDRNIDVFAEMELRRDIFDRPVEAAEERKPNFADISEYRTANPQALLPRILLICDEFQMFFTETDFVAQETTKLLDLLVRQGRAFGIHVILASQTLGGQYALPLNIIRQMAVRIALACEDADSRIILSDDNPAAKDLANPGAAIYNAANGAVGSNRHFQSAWMPQADLDGYLDRISAYAQQHSNMIPKRTPIIFDGTALADPIENRTLNAVIAAPNWVTVGRVVPAWLGEPVAIKEATSLQFRRQSGLNLLIMGQQEETAFTLVNMLWLSLCAQYPPDDLRCYFLDFTAVDGPYHGFLQDLATRLPHTTRIVRRSGAEAVLGEISTLLQARIVAETPALPHVFLFILGMQSATDLHPADSYGTPDPQTPLGQFLRIVRYGPEMGIHTIVSVDRAANLNRAMNHTTQREFDFRVAFAMSSDDSGAFIGTQAASKIDAFRAILSGPNSQEKFRPYSPKLFARWLPQVTAAITGKQRT